jgi:hypothetical protein
LKELELSHQDMVKNLQLEYDKRITELHEQMQLQAKVRWWESYTFLPSWVTRRLPPSLRLMPPSLRLTPPSSRTLLLHLTPLHQEIRQKYEQRMDTLRDDLELQRKAEIHEIEERKNGQISALMRNHEKAFGDIKNYYNDITLNNLALINTLKEQVEEMKRKEERTEKLMGEITAENRKLVEPLREAKARVTDLEKQVRHWIGLKMGPRYLHASSTARFHSPSYPTLTSLAALLGLRQLASYTQDKQFLRTSKAQLKVQQDTIQHLEWELEVLKQRFADVEAERDELYDRFVRTIYDVQQKSGFKNLVLEKKLAALTESLEKKVRCRKIAWVVGRTAWVVGRNPLAPVVHMLPCRPGCFAGSPAERGFAGFKFGPDCPLCRYKEIGGAQRSSRMTVFSFSGLPPLLLSNLNTRTHFSLSSPGRPGWQEPGHPRPRVRACANVQDAQ